MKVLRRTDTTTTVTTFFTEAELLKVLMPVIPKGAEVRITHDEDDYDTRVTYPIAICITTKTVEEDPA